MRCRAVKRQLSALYDQELPDYLRRMMLGHLAVCRLCAAELSSFARLSQLAQQLPLPSPPTSLPSDFERRQAAASPAASVRRPLANRRHVATALVAIAASILGIVVLDQLVRVGPDQHDALVAATFDRFLEDFASRPESAQRALCQQFAGRRTEITQASRLLGYRPAAAQPVPPGFELDSTYVLKMPCCTCSETLYWRNSGGLVAIFEHEGRQSNWFGNRRCASVRCRGVPATVVETESGLAFTWKRDHGHMTVVGATDRTEVDQLIQHFSTRP